MWWVGDLQVFEEERARDNAFSLKVLFHFKHLFCFFLQIHLGHNTLPNRKSIFRWRLQKHSVLSRDIFSEAVWFESFSFFSFLKLTYGLLNWTWFHRFWFIAHSFFSFYVTSLSCLSFPLYFPWFHPVINYRLLWYRLFSGAIPQQFHPKMTWFKCGHEVCVVVQEWTSLHHLNRITYFFK